MFLTAINSLIFSASLLSVHALARYFKTGIFGGLVISTNLVKISRIDTGGSES